MQKFNRNELVDALGERSRSYFELTNIRLKLDILGEDISRLPDLERSIDAVMRSASMPCKFTKQSAPVVRVSAHAQDLVSLIGALAPTLSRRVEGVQLSPRVEALMDALALRGVSECEMLRWQAVLRSNSVSAADTLNSVVTEIRSRLGSRQGQRQILCHQMRVKDFGRALERYWGEVAKAHPDGTVYRLGAWFETPPASMAAAVIAVVRWLHQLKRVNEGRLCGLAWDVDVHAQDGCSVFLVLAFAGMNTPALHADVLGAAHSTWQGVVGMNGRVLALQGLGCDLCFRGSAWSAGADTLREDLYMASVYLVAGARYRCHDALGGVPLRGFGRLPAMPTFAQELVASVPLAESLSH